jgi:peroxiredoxin
LQAVYADIKSLEGELVVFSGERHDLSAGMATKQGLTFPIVADTGLAIARSFGLVFTLPDDLKGLYISFGIDLPRNTGCPEWELPMPARFVIDRSGIIRSAEVDPDYTTRPEPSDTLAILRRIA